MRRRHKGRKSKNARDTGKGPGWEVWSARANGKYNGHGPGRDAKTLTNRYERRKGKEGLRDEDDASQT